MNRAVCSLALVAVFSLAACEQNHPNEVAAQEEEEQQEPRLVAPTLACFEAADDQAGLNESKAFDLCRFTSSPTGPVECYLAADDELLISEAQSIQLCRCAVDAEPVACFMRAERTTFLSDAQILDLCSARAIYNLRPDCLRYY